MRYSKVCLSYKGYGYSCNCFGKNVSDTIGPSKSFHKVSRFSWSLSINIDPPKLVFDAPSTYKCVSSCSPICSFCLCIESCLEVLHLFLNLFFFVVSWDLSSPSSCFFAQALVITLIEALSWCKSSLTTLTRFKEVFPLFGFWWQSLAKCSIPQPSQ